MPKKKDQKKVASGLAIGLSKNEAVRQAGYAESTVRKKGYAIACRPIVQSLMTDALERRNPTIIDKAAKRLDDCLDAKKFFTVMRGRGEDREISVDEKPDFDVQLKAVDRVMNAFGTLPAKMEMPAPARPPINITFIVGSNGHHAKKPQMVVDLNRETTRPKSKPFTFVVKKLAVPVPA